MELLTFITNNQYDEAKMYLQSQQSTAFDINKNLLEVNLLTESLL